MTSISTHEARRDFARLVELVHYKNQAIQIRRNKRPMAWLVGQPFMRAMSRVLKYLVRHEPALADTLAITLNNEWLSAIEQGTAEVDTGKTIPIEQALND